MIAVVRAVVTLHAAVLLAQPVLAGQMLGGSAGALDAHLAVGGLLTAFVAPAQLLAVAIAGRALGSRLPVVLAAALCVGAFAQMALGNQGVVEVHVPLGVLMFGAAAALLVLAWRPRTA